MESSRGSSNKCTKTLLRDYLHRNANFYATVLKIFSKEIISYNNKCGKQYETLESTLENFTCACMHNL